MKALLVACLTLACALATPLAPARAQAQVDSREGIALQNQIAELRAQVQALRDQLARTPQGGGSALGTYPAPAAGEAAPSDITAQLLGRVQRLEDEVRSLRGHIDEVDNARQRQAEDTSKQIADLKFAIENGGAGAATGAAPPPPGGAPARPPPTMSPPPGNLAVPPAGAAAGGTGVPPPPPPPLKRTPEQILQEGNAALARKDFPAAEKDANAALAAGAGPKTSDAQFLLARARYGKRDFVGAAVAYYDAYNHSRTGLHAQDDLLGLASSLYATADRPSACQTLDKLAAEFPSLRPDLKAPVAALRHDAACH